MLSFHDLYSRYAEDVYRFAFWLTGNAVEAQDLTSETFVRAWTSKDSLKLPTVKSYLLTIARNCYLQARRNKKQNVEIDASMPDPAQAADQNAELQSEIHLLAAALQQLPESARAALLMRAHEGLSYEEIAQALQLSVSAVKVKIHRARNKLKQLRTKWQE